VECTFELCSVDGATSANPNATAANHRAYDSIDGGSRTSAGKQRQVGMFGVSYDCLTAAYDWLRPTRRVKSDL